MVWRSRCEAMIVDALLRGDGGEACVRVRIAEPTPDIFSCYGCLVFEAILIEWSARLCLRVYFSSSLCLRYVIMWVGNVLNAIAFSLLFFRNFRRSYLLLLFDVVKGLKSL